MTYFICFNNKKRSFSEKEIEKKLININERCKYIENKINLSDYFRNALFNINKNEYYKINKEFDFISKLKKLNIIHEEIKDNPKLIKCYETAIRNLFKISKNNLTIPQSQIIKKINALIDHPNFRNIDGICHGLTLLFGYYNFINKKDDFFSLILDTHLSKSFNLNKNFNSLNEKEKDIFLFFNNFIFLQEQQKNFPIKDFSTLDFFNLTSEKLKEMNLKTLYKTIEIFHKDENDVLVNKLHKLFTNYQKAPKLIILSTREHSVGFFCKNSECTFFDSNQSFRFPSMQVNDKDKISLIIEFLMKNYQSEDGSLPFYIEVIGKATLNKQFVELENQTKKEMQAKISKGEVNPHIFLLAVFYADLDLISLMIRRRADIEKTSKGVKPLVLAAAKGLTNVVKTLLDHGAKVDSYDSFGFSPILIAAKYGRCDVIEELIKRKPKIINSTDEENKTPLYIAAEEGYLDIVKLLSQKGADIDILDKNNKTPLIVALENNHIQIVKFLLEAGVKIDKTLLKQAKNEEISALFHSFGSYSQEESDTESDEEAMIFSPFSPLNKANFDDSDFPSISEDSSSECDPEEMIFSPFSPLNKENFNDSENPL